MIQYPTRKGIAVPTYEVRLPVSRLDTSSIRNYNIHHLEFPRKAMGKNALTLTLMNLTTMQEPLPMDIHNMGKYNLHSIYGPPRFPTPKEVMDRLDDAYYGNEMLHTWNQSTLSYDVTTFTETLYKHLQREYERVK